MLMTGGMKITAEVKSGMFKGKTVEIVEFSNEQSFGTNMETYAVCLFNGFLRSIKLTDLTNVKYETR